MIDFHPISLDDKAWINACLKYRCWKNCEYSFGNIFSYGKIFGMEAALFEGCLITRSMRNGRGWYCFPAGNGNVQAALLAVINDIRYEGLTAKIYGMSREDAELFNLLFDGDEKAEAVRDSFDYCYSSDDLINLSGKKYQAKRNHISFFTRNNNWSYETMTPAHSGECFAMSREWLEGYTGEDRDYLETELLVIKTALDNFDALDFKGGIVRADGKVVAFALGEELDKDHFCVHFEKAFSSVRGAYPMINQQFVKNELSSYKYINREDDVGLENLRKAKLSYHPAFFVEKFEVTVYPEVR